MKYILNLCISIMLLVLSSCLSDIENINSDPLVATQADPNLLFPEVLLNASMARTVELTPGLAAISQHWASGGSAGVFLNPERYTISTFTTGNTWNNYYVSGLKNLFLAKNDATLADPIRMNVIAQANIYEAFLYYNLTCLWEKVPYIEAINPEFSSPKFDEQKTVLDGIVSLIDEANTLFTEAEGDEAQQLLVLVTGI
jgi:hypothetical protein